MAGSLPIMLRSDESPEGEFMEHVNLEIVKAQRVSTPEGEAIVKGLIEKHVELTGSPKAKQVLGDWENNLPKFWQLVPPGEQFVVDNRGRGNFHAWQDIWCLRQLQKRIDTEILHAEFMV